MNKGYYKTLERDELISLAYSEKNKIERFDLLEELGSFLSRLAQNRTDNIPTKKAEELEAIISDVREEIFRRYDMVLHCSIIPERSSNLDCDDVYYISFVVREDKLLIDCCAIYDEVHSYEFQRKDGKKEIPDEQLLHEKPHKWLSEHLNEYKEISSSSFGVR